MVETIGFGDLDRRGRGDLRVVYLVDDREHLIIVLKVARRSESTYRRTE